MSVKSYALTTRQRLKDFAGISADDDTTNNVIDRIIDTGTEFIERYVGFRIKLTSYTEEYDTDYSDSLLLNSFPVSSSATFTLQRRDNVLNESDWETIGSTYYFIDYDNGIIYGAGSWRFSRSRRGFRVIYSAGFDFDNSATYLSDTEGGDLEWAMWQLGTSAWNRKSGGGGIEREAIGDYSVTYSKAVIENEDLKAILDKYAKRDAMGVLTPKHY